MSHVLPPRRLYSPQVYQDKHKTCLHSASTCQPYCTAYSAVRVGVGQVLVWEFVLVFLRHPSAKGQTSDVLIYNGKWVDGVRAEVAEVLSHIDQDLDGFVQKHQAANKPLMLFMLAGPNMSDEEDENKEMLCWDEPHSFDFDVKDHFDLDDDFNELNVDLRAKITGSRFAKMHREISGQEQQERMHVSERQW